jgi:hypothetical protein
MTTNRPAHEVKVGRVRATLWPRDTKHGTRYSVTVGRLYKTEDAGWKTSSSLDLEDLLLAAKALDLADSWIRENAKQRADAEQSAEEAV